MSKLLDYLFNKNNIIYVIIFLIGFAVAVIKYSFLSAVVAFGSIIVIGVLIGIIINAIYK